MNRKCGEIATFIPPSSQDCIRTTLAQSSDSLILIGQQFYNEILKIVGTQARFSDFGSSTGKQGTIINVWVGKVAC